jgi:cytochrome c5
LALRGAAQALVAALIAAGACARAETVEKLYMDRCAICHLPGINGAPQVGDRNEWARRVSAGLRFVYRSALDGMPNTAMLAKGGHDDLSEAEVRAVVDYMIAAARLDDDKLAAARRYDGFRITSRDFARLDVNRDGALSPAEVAGDDALARAFTRLDANRDGRWSEPEYLAAEATLARERSSIVVGDAKLVADVRAALARVKGIELDATRVEARDGRVTIVGLVEHADVARRAGDAVKRIPGVKRIDNRLVSGHQIGWD